MKLKDVWRRQKKFSLTRIFFFGSDRWEKQRVENFPSQRLGRPVRVDIFLPPGHYRREKRYPVLVFNDGQDMEAVRLLEHLEAGRIRPLIVAAVHAGDRMQEYGVTGRPDYRRRGRRARAYGRFITEELAPWLRERYHCAPPPAGWGAAGFSLGGLSAFDLAWHYPQYFQLAGVFSGSFWWRSRAFKDEDPDADRIAHATVARGPRREGLRFWFQTGTNDETEDRNNNGVIDAIDDTLDLIAELKKLGYDDRDIRYVEVEDGEHNPQTWGEVLPDFLSWGWGSGK